MTLLRKLHLALFAFVCAVSVRADSLDQPIALRVKLLSPLDTTTTKQGDTISGQVTSPPEFAGDFMEGKVQESKSGNKIKGKSVLNFTFDKLRHGGSDVPVQSSIQSLTNSKGQENVDEEGRVIHKKNQVGKVAGAAAAGAIIGAVIGGAKGAAIGAGAGAGVALVLVQFAVEGPKISFAPGTEFILTVQRRR